MLFNPCSYKKTFLLPFLAAVVMLLGTSCQKVIDVDIKNAEKIYVVEAIVTDTIGESKVLLSQSKNVSEPNNFPGISGAEIIITDNTGVSTMFTETAAGSYEASGFIGTAGKTYSLRVKINGELFTATSTMPRKINLDTLFTSNEILFGETRTLANIAYQDPAGKGQYYRYVQYVNGKKTKPIFTNNDDYSDGKKVETKLWYLVDDDENKEEEINSGDTVMIRMHCIDLNIYKYWYSVNQSATGNSQSASPANPVSNIIGGALGYFSVQTIQSKSVMVP